MKTHADLTEISIDELRSINGGEKEWLLLFWGAGLVWGIVATGLYVGYNEEMAS